MMLYSKQILQMLFILFFIACASLEIYAVEFHESIDLIGGGRFEDDPFEDDKSILEARLQLDLKWDFNNGGVRLKTDIIYDYIEEDYYDGIGEDSDIDLEDGSGWLDLREANYYFSPVESIDIKIGRQILTWGTGDLIFINDLFPKDWRSLFIGRNEEYLKAPSDALKVGVYGDALNLELVYTPKFDPDRFITGKRLSYWHFVRGERAGQNAIANIIERDEAFDDQEIALRIYKDINSYEVSLYGYYGFWKSPTCQGPLINKGAFPELRVYGASLRGQIFRGIGNIEVGYYDSYEDKDGNNLYIDNSQVRFLIGYEIELASEFVAGLQYYFEHMDNYDEYLSTYIYTFPPKEEDRHVVALRLTKSAFNQNLMISLFTFYSPTDEDYFILPKLRYKFSDYWTGQIGANIFGGKDDYTFFNQFEKNSNAYLSVKYGF